MGSRQESLEDPMVYVAVGKDVKAEGHSILLWALQNSGGKRICVLHLHKPAQRIPFSKYQIYVYICTPACLFYFCNRFVRSFEMIKSFV
jgi:hypothetical protein